MKQLMNRSRTRLWAPTMRSFYQVLSPAGTIWQTQYIGSARDDASGMVVATNLQGLQRQFPDQQVRAVTGDGRLTDIRT